MKSKTSKDERSLNLHSAMLFYFKVNNSKLGKPEVMERQINKICKRLIKKHNIKSKEASFRIGRFDGDFINDRCRLEISFNYY